MVFSIGDLDDGPSAGLTIGPRRSDLRSDPLRRRRLRRSRHSVFPRASRFARRGLDRDRPLQLHHQRWQQQRIHARNACGGWACRNHLRLHQWRRSGWRRRSLRANASGGARQVPGLCTVLRDFSSTKGNPVGSGPEQLTLAIGAIFSACAHGGASRAGTVLALTPSAPGQPWTEKIVHTFNGFDGISPNGGLLIAPNGLLYGTTSGRQPVEQGGGPRYGTVYSLQP